MWDLGMCIVQCVYHKSFVSYISRPFVLHFHRHWDNVSRDHRGNPFNTRREETLRPKTVKSPEPKISHLAKWFLVSFYKNSILDDESMKFLEQGSLVIRFFH